MPILAIAIALTILAVLLVAAAGPALRIAQRRAPHGEIEDFTYVPAEWQRESGRVTARRFVPTPATQTAEPVASERPPA